MSSAVATPSIPLLCYAAGFMGYPWDAPPNTRNALKMIAERAGLDFAPELVGEPPSAEDLAAAARLLRNRNNSRVTPNPNIDQVAAWLEAGAP